MQAKSSLQAAKQIPPIIFWGTLAHNGSNLFGNPYPFGLLRQEYRDII